MSAEQAAPTAEYRATIALTLPLSVLRRLEPYKAERRRGAFIQDAIVAALEQTEQDHAPAAEPEPAWAEP
jgi:hypothetical protein